VAKSIKAKKEIDKELMYKKLMPSGLEQVKTSIESAENGTSAQREQVEQAAVSVDAGDALLQEKHTPKPHAVSMPEVNAPQTSVVNVMEMAVLEKLGDVLTRFKCCRCDRCQKDIVALALNKLPPKYTVLNKGQPVPDLDPQTRAQVLTALIQSVIKVRANPRH
jgi:hypothetical protein